MKRISTILYILYALLFIVGILIKNKYIIAAGFLLAAILFVIDAVRSTKKEEIIQRCAMDPKIKTLRLLRLIVSFAAVAYPIYFLVTNKSQGDSFWLVMAIMFAFSGFISIILDNIKKTE